MSVSNTGDASPQKSLLNGSTVHTETDSFRSYASEEESSPIKLPTLPSESPSSSHGDSPNSSISGTPRVIRRVGPITAVYAPDKDALAASVERLSASSPVPPTERSFIEREIVIRSLADSDRILDVPLTINTPSLPTEFITITQPSNAVQHEASDRDMLTGSEANSSLGHTPHSKETQSRDYGNADSQSRQPDTSVTVEPMSSSLVESAKMGSPVHPNGDAHHLSLSPQVEPSSVPMVTAVCPVVADIGCEQSVLRIDQGEPHPEATTMAKVSAGLELLDSPIAGPVISADRDQSAFHSVTPRTDSSESAAEQQLPSDHVKTSPVFLLQEFKTDPTAKVAPLLSDVGLQEESETNLEPVVYVDPQHTQSASIEKLSQTASDHINSSVETSDFLLQTAEGVRTSSAAPSVQLSPDLASIADRLNSEPDPELQTVLRSRESQDFSPVALTRSDPVTRVSLSRYSPAQLVAVTGGASPELVRKLENGDEPGAALNTPVTGTPVPRASGSGSSLSRRRMSAPDDESISPIAIPAIDLQVKLDTKLDPSTPEEVDKSSKLVFGSFIAERYKLEVTASATASVRGARLASANASTSVEIAVPSTSRGEAAAGEQQRLSEDDLFGTDLASIPRSNPDSMEMAVARNLAQIGDEINRRYGPRLDRMIKLLPVTECPMESFSRVARALFSRGPTNWGQIVTLFYFGYRLVIRRVRSDVANAFLQVYNCLITFCRQLNIFRWIAEQGGWLILKYLRLVKTSETSTDSNTNCEAQPVSTQTAATSASGGQENQPGVRSPPTTTFSTVLALSSGIAAACVALFVYRHFHVRQ